jgi:hypothetical protein
MCRDVDKAIEALRNEAIARCTERVLRASKQKKRPVEPEYREVHYGPSFALRSRHAL